MMNARADMDVADYVTLAASLGLTGVASSCWHDQMWESMLSMAACI
jgi:hypothetical protein